jgi:mannose-6-phosphate isomerase-like protein (cupin superfamily)
MSRPAAADEWPGALDALIAARDFHTLLLENAEVRVLDTRIPPGGRTPVHTHRWPSVLYILSWSAFVRRDAEDRIVLDSRTVPALSDSPGVLWSPPLAAHSLENVGPLDLRVISVELKGS